MLMFAACLKYKHDSERDIFTNLYHKHWLLGDKRGGSTLIRWMKRTKKTGKSFGALFLDLDGFKKFNDDNGHIEGDKLILQIVDIIQNSIRQSPLAILKRLIYVGRNPATYISYTLKDLKGVLKCKHWQNIFKRRFWFSDCAVRFGGGDEFIVLVNDTEETFLKLIAQRLANRIQNKTGLTISIGGSIFTKKDTIKQETFVKCQEKFMKRMDDAMYIVKNNGKNGLAMTKTSQQDN
jgi:GGDEF domain-containing protein